jgi:small subunit ribosomal protein S1
MSKKKSVDLFGDDTEVRAPNEFEQLLQSSGAGGRRIKVGDRLRGEVLAINASEAFVSTGTAIDAVMPLNPAAEPPFKVGDLIDVTVVRATETEVLVKGAFQRGGDGPEADNLEDAYEMELPVEGTVLEVVKGGFRVKVHGEKAFCPVSQIDFSCKVPEDYVGRKYQFIITRYERGRDLVVSRRKLLDLERAGSEADFLRDAKIDEVYSATVFRLEKYGAFVRLENNVEGLIPISEMSWNRINHPQEVVNMDQVVQVKLMRIQEEGSRLRVSFSLKQGGSVQDPWATIEQEYPVGTTREGTVERRESYGMFVNIGVGISGLLPRSAWRDHEDQRAFESKRPGDRVAVRVDRLDLDQRRLSFSLPREEEDESWREQNTGASTNAGFGTMADLFKGVTGKRS